MLLTKWGDKQMCIQSFGRASIMTFSISVSKTQLEKKPIMKSRNRATLFRKQLSHQTYVKMILHLATNSRHQVIKSFYHKYNIRTQNIF